MITLGVDGGRFGLVPPPPDWVVHISTRFLECLINVIESISYCSNNEIEGAIVAVDMAKAFDTLSHGFLREVFKFFNFGPYLCAWLELLGQNHTASIILDDGTYCTSGTLV
jgi:hypothetical protein